MIELDKDGEKVFQMVDQKFKGYPGWDEEFIPIVRNKIKATDPKRNTFSCIRETGKFYFKRKNLKTASETEKNRLLIFQTMYVAIISKHEEIQARLWPDTNELKAKYNHPYFQNANKEELERLLRFRNAVCVALLVLPALLNKARIMLIAETLEGDGIHYITGDGQTAATTARVAIYEQEGNIVKKKRPYQSKTKTDDDSGRHPELSTAQQTQSSKRHRKVDTEASSGSSAGSAQKRAYQPRQSKVKAVDTQHLPEQKASAQIPGAKLLHIDTEASCDFPKGPVQSSVVDAGMSTATAAVLQKITPTAEATAAAAQVRLQQVQKPPAKLIRHFSFEDSADSADSAGLAGGLTNAQDTDVQVPPPSLFLSRSISANSIASSILRDLAYGFANATPEVTALDDDFGLSDNEWTELEGTDCTMTPAVPLHE